MFAKETYVQRRAVLKSKVKSGLILLVGNDETGMNYADNWYHFRQDSTFLYYLGLAQAGLHAVLDCDSGEEFLFGDDLTIDHIVWTGPQPTIAELAESTGVKHSAPIAQVAAKLRAAIDAGRAIHFIPPYREKHTLFIAEVTGLALGQIATAASETLIKAIVSQRSIKTADEIAEIDRATTITANMHLKAMQITRPGMKEYEIAAAVHEVALAGGGNLSFPIILTKDGQTLHNHFHGNTVKEGDMVLCDAGAETPMGYCGDMTRTFPVGKTFTPIQKELYNIVLAAHEAAIAALRPGVKYKDVYLLACRTLFDGLKLVGLTQGDAHEAVAAGAHAMFFQCGLGHMMGMDVHDMENLGEQYVGYTEPKSTQFGMKSLRLGRELEPGFVLTVEPGIYIIPQLIDMWRAQGKFKEYIRYDQLEKFRNFGGIRVEEDFVITETGSQLLGTPIAKTIADIEAVRA